MRGEFLEVLGPTRHPKIGFDSNAGSFAYVMPHGQAFVKRYPSPKQGVYPEIAGLTLCFWYPQASQVPACELEPHGPRTTIAPERASVSPKIGTCSPIRFHAPGSRLISKNSQPRSPRKRAEGTRGRAAADAPCGNGLIEKYGALLFCRLQEISGRWMERDHLIAAYAQS